MKSLGVNTLAIDERKKLNGLYIKRMDNCNYILKEWTTVTIHILNVWTAVTIY